MFEVKTEETAGELGIAGFSVYDSHMGVVSVEPEAATVWWMDPHFHSQHSITISEVTSPLTYKMRVMHDVRISASQPKPVVTLINLVAASYSLDTLFTSQ